MPVLDEVLRRAEEFLRSNDEFVIVSHYDADGLTSGAIASLLLDRLGKDNKVIPVKKLDEAVISKLADLGKPVIFVDLGSGQLDYINREIGSYLVCDHHETISDVEPKGIHMNAHLFGMDGAKEISGAGMVYLLARFVNRENVDLSAIAVVGAVGDMQDSRGALIGKNREIVNDGVMSGVIERKVDIRLFGRHTRPLIQFLSYSSDPFLPGLTGNEERCARFLAELGIPVKSNGRWLRYVDLSSDLKRKLVTGLYVYGIESGLDDTSLQSLVGEVYELAREEEHSYTRDAKDFATLLNACGRHGSMDIGVEVAKGDRDKAYKRAVSILQEHRRSLHDAVKWVYENGIKDLGVMYVIDAGKNVKDTIVGIVAGMMYHTDLISQDKPVIAFALDEEGMLKVSGRANWKLVRKGVHLGRVMKEAAQSLGGEGGGHSIAAGARISPDKKEEFVRRLSSLLASQLKGRGTYGSPFPNPSLHL